MENHLQALQKLCRICGGNVNKYRVSYKALYHKESLKTAFGIDVETDHQDLHPSFFCDGCFAIIKRKENAVKEEKMYIHSVEVFEWFPHSLFCYTCDSYNTLKKGERPKKKNEKKQRDANK